MKKYLLLLALVCLLGNRALAQNRSSFSEEQTITIDFKGFNRGWDNNPSDIDYVGSDNYIKSIKKPDGSRQSFCFDGLYYIGLDVTDNWRIGHVNNTGNTDDSYLQKAANNQNDNYDTDVSLHNLKVGDEVTIYLQGSCTLMTNNTNLTANSSLSGEATFTMKRLVDNNNECGNVILRFNGAYTGISKIVIKTKKPYFNYDPGYEVYDMFSTQGKNASTIEISENDPNTNPGFSLNNTNAKYLTIPGAALTLNNRVAVSSTGWTVQRGIRAPQYDVDNTDWYNFSICNLKKGDRVEIFYTGTAPTFSSVGKDGAYNGCAAFIDMWNDGEYNPGEGDVIEDQMVTAGLSVPGSKSRVEGNIVREENHDVWLYTSQAIVITEDGHLDLGLMNGNYTRIVKIKVYSDHQATMIDDESEPDYQNTSRFDITGELQAKEHIVPGGLEVRVGNEDKTQHAIVVSSKEGPVSYVNAVDGFKLPGITKKTRTNDQNEEEEYIDINFNLGDNALANIPTTGTFYKFMPLVSGTMKVKFTANSMYYYRYDIPGNSIYYDDAGWLVEFDRGNEQTYNRPSPYYIKVSSDNGATFSDAQNITWNGGTSVSGGGSSSSGSDISLQNGDVLTLDRLSSFNPDDEVIFHFSNVNGNDIGGLSPANWNHYDNPKYPFQNNNQSSWDKQYTVAQIREMAKDDTGNNTDGVKLCRCYNATITVTLPSSGDPGSTPSVHMYDNGEDAEFVLEVEAGKIYYLFGGWTSNDDYQDGKYESSDYIRDIDGRLVDGNWRQITPDVCGVAELFDVAFTPFKDVFPLAKWVPSGTTDDDDLAIVIGYQESEITVKKMSGNITGCEPYIDGDKLKIRNITFKDGENPGGVILIKFGTNLGGTINYYKVDPVYVFTVAYDANYHSTSNVAEELRGHTWDFSSNSLSGLDWEPTQQNVPKRNQNGIFENSSSQYFAQPKAFGTYFNNFFSGGESSGVNSEGSFLIDEMDYVDNGVNRSDWTFNYRQQKNGVNYDPRFLNKYDMVGDNADMIWDTEGIIIETNSNFSCIFNEFGDGNVHASTKDPDRYVGILSGGSFLIPHLNKDDRVIIYMGSGTDADEYDKEDMKFRITNARDALYNPINCEYDEDKKVWIGDVYLAGGSQWQKDKDNKTNEDKYGYFGCYHFFAKEDGDMKFTLEGTNSICKLYKIQIYRGDRINTNNVVGVALDDNGKPNGNHNNYLLWSTDDDPNVEGTATTTGPTYNWSLQYFCKDQKLADGTGTNSQENEIIAKSGNINKDISTNTTINTFTYEHELGEIGTFRVRGKDMEKNMNYVADYADHNVTVAYQETQKYPYTWDFGDATLFHSEENGLFQNEDAIGDDQPADVSDEFWAAFGGTTSSKTYERTSRDLSLWEILENGSYRLRLNSQTAPKAKDNIFETAKSIDGNQIWAGGKVVPETQGLWFYTENNNQDNGGLCIISNDGMKLNGFANWPYGLVIPNVPAKAAVYLRMRNVRGMDNTSFTDQFKGTGNFEVYTPVAVPGTEIVDEEANITYQDYVFAILNNGETKRHLVLSFGGYELKKLAVSKDPKKVNIRGWATESRDHVIDPELTAYMTGKDFETCLVTNVDYAAKTVTLTRVHSSASGSDSNNGKYVMSSLADGGKGASIIHNRAVTDLTATNGEVSILDGGFHLFVPDMHDYKENGGNENKKRLTGDAFSTNMLVAQVSPATGNGKIPGIEGDYTNYALTYKYLRKSDGIIADGEELNDGVEAFYRIATNGASSSGNQGYLPLLTNPETPSGPGNSPAKFSIIFEEEFENINPGITTTIDDIESSGRVVTSEGFYNLNGQKINGIPTQKGMYIVNGKKVLVK